MGSSKVHPIFYFLPRLQLTRPTNRDIHPPKDVTICLLPTPEFAYTTKTQRGVSDAGKSLLFPQEKFGNKSPNVRPWKWSELTRKLRPRNSFQNEDLTYKLRTLGQDFWEKWQFPRTSTNPAAFIAKDGERYLRRLVNGSNLPDFHFVSWGWRLTIRWPMFVNYLPNLENEEDEVHSRSRAGFPPSCCEKCSICPRVATFLCLANFDIVRRVECVEF